MPEKAQQPYLVILDTLNPDGMMWYMPLVYYGLDAEDAIDRALEAQNFHNVTMGTRISRARATLLDQVVTYQVEPCKDPLFERAQRLDT